MEILKELHETSPSFFQDPLIQIIKNIQGDRREDLTIPLLQAMMQVCGLSDRNGFTSTTNKCARNHLRLRFGKDLEIHGILDWALWQEAYYFDLAEVTSEMHDCSRLIMHATGINSLLYWYVLTNLL